MSNTTRNPLIPIWIAWIWEETSILALPLYLSSILHLLLALCLCLCLCLRLFPCPLPRQLSLLAVVHQKAQRSCQSNDNESLHEPIVKIVVIRLVASGHGITAKIPSTTPTKLHVFSHRSRFLRVHLVCRVKEMRKPLGEGAGPPAFSLVRLVANGIDLSAADAIPPTAYVELSQS